MKVYVSADIEGVTGTTHWDETEKQKPDYSEFREQMTAEVSAAGKALLSSDVTVKSSVKLEPERLFVTVATLPSYEIISASNAISIPVKSALNGVEIKSTSLAIPRALRTGCNCCCALVSEAIKAAALTCELAQPV